jgi:hypothetical protein
MFTTLHLLVISSFHNASGRFSFISYYMSMPFQPCFPHPIYNIYHSRSSSYLSIPLFFRSHIISTLLLSPSLQCPLLHIFLNSPN